LNGVPLQPGDQVLPTDNLQFVPPTDTVGEITAFTLQATDGVSSSVPLAISLTIGNRDLPETDLPETLDINPGLDPSLGVPEPLPILDVFTEPPQLTGSPLAQSPVLEELSVLGAVLPEAGYQIVAVSQGGQSNSSTPGVLTNGSGPSEGQSEGGGKNSEFGKPEPPDDSDDVDDPLDGEDDLPGGEDDLPGGEDDLPGGEDDLPGDEDISGDEEPAGEGELIAEQEPDDADSTEGDNGDGEVARNPEDEETSDAADSSSPMAAGLKNCQDQADNIQNMDGRDRNQPLYANLIDCHQQNLATAKEQNNSPWIAYSLNNLAISHFVTGDYLTALDFYEQQLEQAKQLNDATQAGIALGGIGAVYGALGEYDTAIDFYNRSLRELSLDTAPQWKALTYRNLGNAHFAKKDYDRAAEFQLSSLDISQATEDTYGEMQAQSNLGHTRSIQGDFAGAIAAYTTGLTLAEQLDNDLEKHQILIGLSATYAYQQQYEQSYNYAQQGLTLARSLGATLGEGLALTNIGNALLELNQLPDAEQALVEAVVAWESLRAGLGTNNSFKVSIFETQQAAYRNLEEVLVNQNKLEAALEVSERGRARAFVELLARGNANPSQGGSATPLSIDQIKQTAQAQNSTLVEYTIIRDQVADTPHGASAQRPIEPEDVQLYIWVVQPTGQIHLESVDLKTALSSGVTNLVNLVETSRQRSGIPGEFASNSRDDNRALSLQIGDQVRRVDEPPNIDPYTVDAIDRQAGTVTLSTASGFNLPNPVPLSEVSKINAFAPVLRRQQHWRDLHQILIDPITHLLPTDPNARVVFIPQEQLFLVPFPALQAENGSYLIENHTIVTAPAIQILTLTDRDSPPSSGQPLVVGNPSPMPTDNLSALPYAGNEANGIANLLSTEALIGQTATESAIKQQLSTASLIHLATHGFFDEDQPLNGSLALAPGNNQDGFLTADEILSQSLRADLVVLSACDTGLGKITGDGVIGLSRSFLAAGADNVMVSLWKVPDNATAELMVEFYRQRQTLDDAQALRQAMLVAREQYDDPVDWAAFTLIGAIE
ncbi:MAG: CHAT domain-containing protein, partial [Leptolyngbyaceae cyanobacterium MAG.088]|nr:CHAT domain-containing protein [Leptolyngbyaceae cyanobacterium MAG.088]